MSVPSTRQGLDQPITELLADRAATARLVQLAAAVSGHDATTLLMKLPTAGKTIREALINLGVRGRKVLDTVETGLRDLEAAKADKSPELAPETDVAEEEEEEEREPRPPRFLDLSAADMHRALEICKEHGHGGARGGARITLDEAAGISAGYKLEAIRRTSAVNSLKIMQAGVAPDQLPGVRGGSASERRRLHERVLELQRETPTLAYAAALEKAGYVLGRGFGRR